MKKKAIYITCVLLTMLIGFMQLAPDGKQTDKIDFSNVRNIVEEMTTEPHEAGTKRNEEIAKYLVDKLKSFGFEIEVQSKVLTKAEMEKRGFNVNNVKLNEKDEVKINNIVATLDLGFEDDVLLSTHYDTKPTTYGAADCAVCTSSVVETARVLIEDKSKLKNNLTILLTDGEEAGLIGANIFVEENLEFMEKLDFVLNYEARGNAGQLYTFESGKNSSDYIKFAAQNSTMNGISLGSAVYDAMPNPTDFSVYKKLGIEGLNSALIQGGSTYHTLEDSNENLADSVLQDYASTVYTMTSSIMSTKISEILNGQTGSFYHPISLLNTVFVEPVVYFGFNLLAIGLFLVMIFLKRKELASVKLVYSSIIDVAIIGGAGVLFYQLSKMIILANNIEYNAREVLMHAELDIYFYLFAILICLISGISIFWRQKKLGDVQKYSIMIILLIFSVATMVYFMAASYLFTLPLLMMSLTAILKGKLKYISTILLIPLVIFYFVVIVLVYAALTFTLAVIPLVVIYILMSIIINYYLLLTNSTEDKDNS
ncbi:MAG: M28 family peptidase [Mycoplasmatales bacterium]